MTSADDRENSPVSIVAPSPSLCLDFANTVAYRGSTAIESLHSFGDLLKWCREAASLPFSIAEQLERWQEKHPRRIAEIFKEAIALRESIYRIFHSLASGATPNDADLAHLNRVLSEAPPRDTIQRLDTRFGWVLADAKSSTASVLAPVLWSAGDLLVGPQHARLRECSNEKCLWLFLDDSKNGTRRWCSMQACGNRAKAHRHYMRHKGE